MQRGLFSRPGIVDLDIIQNGAKGGVAAVIGPVGVDHLDLSDGGVALLGAEVLLAELDVPQIHGQTLFLDELGKACLIQLVEALQHCHGSGHGVIHLQGFFGLQRSLAGFHGVDDILLDLGHLLGGQSALQQVDTGRAHQRALALTDELDALGGRVGALVELAGQVLHGKRHAAVRSGQLRIGIVHRRLAEHSGHALLEQCLVDALHVVAVEQPQAAQLLDAQQRDQLVAQALGLAVEAGFLFNIDTIYHWVFPSCIDFSVRAEPLRRAASPYREEALAYRRSFPLRQRLPSIGELSAKQTERLFFRQRLQRPHPDVGALVQLVEVDVLCGLVGDGDGAGRAQWPSHPARGRRW